ncbi:MAG TPA: ABC transporter permease [Fusobacteriaceae bacterium]|nr:ABC transporter permease [Fusobacteriaceae bacterium]
MKKSVNTEKNNLFLISLLILIIGCEIIIRILKIPRYILPTPTSIILALYNQKEILLKHSLVTLFEALTGFFLSIVFALIIGGIVYPFKKIKKMLYPYLLISQTIPLIAIAPIILIWFGFGIMPKILIVILICTFPILLNFLGGLEEIDQDILDLFQVMGASKKYIFFKVILPSSLPNFFSGIKISATYSIMGAVIGEWLGAKSGLGIYMTRAISSFKTDYLFASIIVVVVLSLGIFKVIEYVEKSVMPWKKVKN